MTEPVVSNDIWDTAQLQHAALSDLSTADPALCKEPIVLF